MQERLTDLEAASMTELCDDADVTDVDAESNERVDVLVVQLTHLRVTHAGQGQAKDVTRPSTATGKSTT